MNIENIKESTKDSIIQSFMENAKFARRGSQHQRPKSWSKGTKSGSDKKKMRREGKRETRELHESPDWVSAALLEEQNPHFPNYDNPEMHGDYSKTVSPEEAERIKTLQFAHGPFMKYIKSTHEEDPAGAAHSMLGYLGAMIKGGEPHDALHHVMSSYHDIKGTAGGHKEIPF